MNLCSLTVSRWGSLKMLFKSTQIYAVFYREQHYIEKWCVSSLNIHLVFHLKKRWRLQALIYAYFEIIFQYWENVASKAKFWWLFRGNYSRDVFTWKHICCKLFALYLVLVPFVMTGNMLAQCSPWLKKT